MPFGHSVLDPASQRASSSLDPSTSKKVDAEIPKERGTKNAADMAKKKKDCKGISSSSGLQHEKC